MLDIIFYLSDLPIEIRQLIYKYKILNSKEIIIKNWKIREKKKEILKSLIFNLRETITFQNYIISSTKLRNYKIFYRYLKFISRNESKKNKFWILIRIQEVIHGIIFDLNFNYKKINTSHKYLKNLLFIYLIKLNIYPNLRIAELRYLEFINFHISKLELLSEGRINLFNSRYHYQYQLIN